MIFQDIILVGAGGTGSRVVAPLIQTIKQSARQINPQLVIVDGDVFEENNLTRQNCIRRDMGRNKAVVMAERYGAALDFPVVAHPNYITKDTQLSRDLSESAVRQGKRRLLETRRLFILCVDNIEARINIINKIGKNDVIIDCGNEDTFGQVSIFDNFSVPHFQQFSSANPDSTSGLDLKPFSNDIELPFIPSVLTSYIYALDNPSQATRSCADLDQSLAINNLMAAGVINKVQNLAFDNEFHTRTDYFDLLRGNSSERMTHTWFNQTFTERLIRDSNAEFNTDIRSVYRNLYYNTADRLKIDTLINYVNETAEFVDPRLLGLFK